MFIDNAYLCILHKFLFIQGDFFVFVILSFFFLLFLLQNTGKCQIKHVFIHMNGKMDLKIESSALYLPISMSCGDYFRRLLRMSNELLTQPLFPMADQWKQSAGVLFIENIENSISFCVNKIIHLITLVIIKNTVWKIWF